jgi:BirA family transcriptional regulator, biotin operon repressor / biotin---[acetyl-CoA-carboxylase] ligase
MTPAPAQTPLDIDALRRARAAARFGHTIHYFDSIDSTNVMAHRLAANGAADGSVVVAEAQTKGQGRLGRTWSSPPFRNLYLSLILRPAIAATAASQITLVAGLAVAEAVGDWTPRAAIKWPNDVVIDGRKVAGILAAMDAENERVRFVILGIGVNLNSAAEDFPPDLREKAIGLCTVVGQPIDRVVFATGLLSRLEARYDLFMREGFAALRAMWEARSCLTGRQVRIEDATRSYEGRVSGIADDGALVLRDAAGGDVRVIAGDVTVLAGYPSDQPAAVHRQPTAQGGS